MRRIRITMPKTLAAILSIALGATASLAGDVVVLRSGTMMEGRVVSLDDDELILEIESGRSILDRGDVRSVHFDTTAAEVGGDDGDAPRAPSAKPKAPPPPDAPDADGGPVFRIGDKEAFDVGDAVETGSLRVRLTRVAVARVRVVDIFGNTKESHEPQLVMEFEVMNVGKRGALMVEGHPVFGERLVRVEDQGGAEIKAQSFGAGSRVEGALQDGHEIDPGDRDGHVEVFKVPGAGVESMDIRVDLSRFGGTGVVRWGADDWE